MNVIKNIPKPLLIGSALCATYGFATLLKEKSGGDRYQGPKEAHNKVVIVTGANTGIGKETAWELARRGAKVYMACRDMNRCEEARKEIVLDTRNKFVYCRPCDLASLDSIRKFVEVFKKEQQQLHILINNAGVMRTPKGSKTAEGFEMQLGVNHLGHFLLTNLLLDVLKASAPSRVINLSSVAHKRGTIKKDDLNSDLEYDPAKAYEQSKLCNILFTKELAVRLKDSGVTVNAVHPGIVDTEIVRHMPFSKSFFAKVFLKPLSYPFTKNARQGCQTVVYLALDPEVSEVTGEYFVNYKREEALEDAELGKWLWKVSEKWTRLNNK
ncbi:retinol dehydrogenase 13-like [Anthonomus grandis grandis]|uniref:retinol dehydrogenase 13-like n=1 Tax=Anthonomus grandis grandis TaxID=2921223 RepID=UPI002165B686|nr:retinol dehydrogenase 13-like [Anthonomus grandis grandis]